MSIVEFILLNVELFLLILVRVAGLFSIAPVLGNENVPMITRLGLSVMISFIMLPLMHTIQPTVLNNFPLYTYFVVQEFAVGIAIGFVGTVYFAMFFLAGTIMDRQTGFALANVIDPLTDMEVPIFGNFYNILFMLLFLGINGHHVFIKALHDSYQYIPIGHTISINLNFVEFAIGLFRDITLLAFVLSAPIMMTAFLANVMLGIFAKTMPQINVFVVGMPLRIIVGLLTVWITLQTVLPFSERFFDRIFRGVYNFMRILT
ncbi:flagellar biosynthetic protein FliR [Tindallia californiensis]|uniref:Flagellar biosynthetic protein FliR n=1 Tax=Tindallia californiensis TaxID=159292 RepID=A0A1H3NT37_9FIRM|nr:flagellar biosynthetic protein FliR [Tindallia californiensis]SDY91339.1 flagellar biosynthetic protein FliR [Tindallia californiensis]